MNNKTQRGIKYFCPLRGGGGGGLKALVDCPLIKELFFICGFPSTRQETAQKAELFLLLDFHCNIFLFVECRYSDFSQGCKTKCLLTIGGHLRLTLTVYGNFGRFLSYIAFLDNL